MDRLSGSLQVKRKDDLIRQRSGSANSSDVERSPKAGDKGAGSHRGSADGRQRFAAGAAPAIPADLRDGLQSVLGVPAVLVSAIAYIATSSALVLLNKHALASFGFGSPNTLLLFHCALSVWLVKACELLGFIQLEPLRWKIVKIYFPVNLLFVGMLVTSFFALRLVGVGMFTVLKNLSNLITITGDYVLYGRTYSALVWLSLLLMAVSACVGSLTDVRFHLVGYTWQLVNCVFTSGYALYLSGVIDRVAIHTSDGRRLSEFSMVYYNNALSLLPVTLLAVGYGELPFGIFREPAMRNPAFLMVAGISGLLGFGISFTSLWFMSRSTATIYSLVGSMNKIIVACAGIALFREIASARNLASIGVGLVAGVVFVMAKASEPKRS